jgi:hypothetical protein
VPLSLLVAGFEFFAYTVMDLIMIFCIREGFFMSDQPVEIIEEDQYHNPGALETIAMIAKALGWAVLVIGLLILGTGIYWIITNYKSAPFIQVWIPFLLQFLFYAVVLFFFFILLLAAAEGIYVLMDIEENTRRK